MNNRDIRYINRDYTALREALVEYAKAYFPQTYNDFSTASPGSMFLDLTAGVGDILNFLLDSQIQETFPQYTNELANMMTVAYAYGYRPKATSAATVTLDVYQLVPAIETTPGDFEPDLRYALSIQDGMRVSDGLSNGNTFYIPENINFAFSSTSSPTEVSVFSVDVNNNPALFLLKKQVPAVSGEVKTQTLSFGSPQKFETRVLTDKNIIQVLEVVDSEGNEWYEVPYLAQDTILDAVENTEAAIPGYRGDSEQVPYFLKVRKVDRRFVTRLRTDQTLEFEFGGGINLVADEAVVPNPLKVGTGVVDSLSKKYTAYDPSNFTTTYTYGLAPGNTVLTVKYIVGGGATANTPTGTLTTVLTSEPSFYFGPPPNNTLGNQILDSLRVSNDQPAKGGSDGDTLEEIRRNTLLQFPTQMRAVTQQDYIAQTYNLPSKFGKIAKAYTTKDSIVLQNQTRNEAGVQDPFSISIYVLTKNIDNHLDRPPLTLKENLKTYLSSYRMLTDTVNILDAYVINIGVEFEIVLRPGYVGREVIARCIQALADYFNTDKWEINQPIVLAPVFTVLDKVQGVQTVKKVEIVNKYGEQLGYSPYAYDIGSATVNGVVYPSLDPSIFEIRFPDQDIRGRIVHF
jgi:hypothetical protein